MPQTLHIDIPPSNPPDVAQSRHERSPARSPTLTYHNSRILGLPTPDFFNPIASGAHYAGALPSPVHEHTKRGHSRRSLGQLATDPAVEAVYTDVLRDIEEVSLRLYHRIEPCLNSV
jgi:hypothetical protein